MFGYIQPFKCELKVREYDYYRAAYCGLCNALRARCGIKARFIVNYDFVLVALLLSYSDNFEEKKTKKRCLVCPSGKMCIDSAAFAKAADISVILTYLKFCDEIVDNKCWKSLYRGRIPRILLSRAYKKASMAIPEFNTKVCDLYNELSALEKSGTSSLDEPADKFAQMLALIVKGCTCNDRVLSQIFYQIGRFVYIIDAFDDVEDDFEKGEYNPIISRYAIESKHLPETVKQEVLTTLNDSRVAVLRAFELLEKTEKTDLIKNIIELGMRASMCRVSEKENKK